MEDGLLGLGSNVPGEWLSSRCEYTTREWWMRLQRMTVIKRKRNTHLWEHAPGHTPPHHLYTNLHSKEKGEEQWGERKDPRSKRKSKVLVKVSWYVRGLCMARYLSALSTIRLNIDVPMLNSGNTYPRTHRLIWRTTSGYAILYVWYGRETPRKKSANASWMIK